MDHQSFLTVAEEAVTLLKRLRGAYPHLISPYVEAAVDNWGKHFPAKDLGMAVERLTLNDEEVMPKVACELIETHQMEDVLEMLSARFSVDVDYDLLLSLIGKERYREALRREADELVANAISLEQIAGLWNSLGKAGPGGQRWTKELLFSLMN